MNSKANKSEEEAARRELKYCLNLRRRAMAGDWRAAVRWLETFRPDEWGKPKAPRRLKS